MLIRRVKNLISLERNQWLSPEELKALNAKMLKKLLISAYKNNQFYREKWQDAGISDISDLLNPSTFSKLPIVTRPEIKSAYPDKIISRGYKLDRGRIKYTSGSSGQPLTIFLPEEAFDYFLPLMYRVLSMLGAKPRHKIVYIKASTEQTGSYLGLFRACPISSFLPVEKMIDVLRGMKPHIISSYASCMWEIAKAVTQEDLKYIKPIAISLNTETSSVEQRDYISKVFNCPVCDDYGTEETWMIASQCLEKRYHIFTDNIIFEVVDEKGRACPPGEMGEVVLTSLINYGMPFIRYKLGDYAVLDEGACACGRGFPVLKSFVGITGEHPFILPSGRVIAPIHIRLIFAAADVGDFVSLKGFKVVQERKDYIKIYLVKDVNYTANIENLFVSKLKALIKEPVKIEIKFVDEIPRAPGCKFHFIESKVKATNP